MSDALDRPVFEKRSLRRLSDEQVATIRQRRIDGEGYKQIGQSYGLSDAAVYNICAGVTYGETHPNPNRDLRARKRIVNSNVRQRQRASNSGRET